MNIQKFTTKSIEAINDCEKLAYDYGNQELEQEHLLRRRMDATVFESESSYLQSSNANLPVNWYI